MEVKTVRDDALACNVYRIGDSLVDAGDDAARLPPESEIDGVYLTHTHADHAGALDEYGVPVYVHESEADAGTVANAVGELRTVEEGDEVVMNDTTFEVLHTPGHSPGSVCYWSTDERILFSGDLLFDNGAPGDVGDGDDSGAGELRDSLQRIASLEPSPEAVYPGHRQPFSDVQERVRIAVNLV